MQTFLHYGPDFKQGAATLDRQRLGKQRVEAWQILNTISGASQGWRNHPAVKMWVGYDAALAVYGYCHCSEWVNRGYKDSLALRFIDVLSKYKQVDMPPWIRDDDFILSHRSNLIRKLPEHYSAFWPEVPNDLPYVWPV